MAQSKFVGAIVCNFGCLSLWRLQNRLLILFVTTFIIFLISSFGIVRDFLKTRGVIVSCNFKIILILSFMIFFKSLEDLILISLNLNEVCVVFKLFSNLLDAINQDALDSEPVVSRDLMILLIETRSYRFFMSDNLLMVT